MKKLILSILFILCLSFQASALGPMMLLSGGGCGGTLNFVTGDTESFEFEVGDFCTTQFTETDPDGIINSYDSAQYKNGGHSASFAWTGTGQDDNFVQANIGAGDDDFTYDFWVKPFDPEGYTSYLVATATGLSGVNNDVGVQISVLYNGTGVILIRAQGANNDTSTSLTPGNWHRVEVDYNRNGVSTVDIYDASNSLIDTLSLTANDFAVQYINFGCISSDADADQTIYFDDVRYKAAGGGF